MMNIHPFWRFLFWIFIINLLIDWVLSPLLVGLFSGIGLYVHDWGISNDLQAILDAGLYLSSAVFLISMALYGFVLFGVYDFKKMNFPPLPKRLFGGYSFPWALMFNAALIFMIFFAIKMSLKQELEKFNIMGVFLPSG